MSSGGYREGAGRKPSANKRVQMVVTVAPSTKDSLQQMAHKLDTTPGRVLDRMLAESK